jgi:hypothetical protein
MTDADCSGLTEFLQDFLLVEVSYPILFLNTIALLIVSTSLASLTPKVKLHQFLLLTARMRL